MPPDADDFLKAFLAINSRLQAYVSALVPQSVDAEEVFQRTCLVLWEKWPNFDASKEFLPWAFGVARIEARLYQTAQGRNSEILEESAAYALAESVERGASQLEERLDALQTCLGRLSRDNRSLLERCYSQSKKLHEIAVEGGMSPAALYQRLKRLREILHDCIDRALVAGQST